VSPRGNGSGDDLSATTLSLAVVHRLNINGAPRRAMARNTMGTRLYVGNLTFSTSQDQLRALFEQNGAQVTDVHLVTDLCRGGELFHRIIEKGSNCDNDSPCFTEAEAARIMYQLLHAVAYMHELDVAHRDIKPENILFETTDEDSPIKIIDFGLSRKHYACEPPMNNVVGTPYYIAPEVLRRSYTKSSDLWSVGVIAYILMCGYPPFNGEDNNAVYDAVRRGRLCFPSAEWSGTSRESRHFIRCLLQRDPRERVSALQALNHPWIVKHIGNKDGGDKDCASVEVVYDQRESVVIADS